VDTSPESQEETVVRPKTLPPKRSALAVHLGVAPAPVPRVELLVAQRFGVTWDEVTGPDRHRRIAGARQVAAWLLRKAGLSFPEIGRVLGARDHTTAMAAVQKIDRERAADPDVATQLDELVRGLSGNPTSPLELQPIHEQLGALRAQETATGRSSGPTASSGSNDGRGQP
jgi:hypothetical protein